MSRRRTAKCDGAKRDCVGQTRSSCQRATTQLTDHSDDHDQRILLCDDEIHILRAAEFKLKRAGYDVRIAGDGQEAWESIQQRMPDMLVTDCQMPRLDGFGLIAADPREPGHPRPAGADAHRQGLRARATRSWPTRWNVIAVIAKPFSPRELLKTVNAILAKRPRSAEATAASSER